MPFTPRQRSWLFLLSLCYLLLGITYALATPPLEASDEYKHYPYVHFVQTKGRLPVLDPAEPGLWLQEAAQPPLYYVLMAALTIWIDTSDLPQVHHKNPQAFIGNPNQIGNKNLIIHDPEREAFPWQGTVLAVYLIRLVSVVLGIGTVIITAELGRCLFTPQVGLLAAGATAFNPMFLFVNAAVNNDSLAILLGHWGLYLLVRIWQDAPPPRNWRRFAGLGLALGLGLLTKLSLGGLWALSGLTLAWLAWQHKEWRFLFISGGIALATALLLSGWWFMRNWQLYGDPTGLNVFIAVQGTRNTPITWQGWVEEFGTFYRSYWGLFGGVNVAAPQIFYVLCNLAAMVGVAGWLTLWPKRHAARRGTWLLAAWAGILFFLLIRWNLISPAFQGRLIFPALGGLNVLWAAGVLAVLPRGWQTRLAGALVGALLVAAIMLPWLVIRPAYALPQPLTAVPPAAQFGPITFSAAGDAIQLVGAVVAPGQTVTPGGGPVEVTLYWQVTTPVAKDYVSSIHLLGRGYTSVGQINRYPASGLIPTSRWRPGQIYRDVYHVYVGKTAVAPSRLRLLVSIFDLESDQPLPAFGPNGTPIEFLLLAETARLAAGPAHTPEPETRLNVPFAGGITLVGYDMIPQPTPPGAIGRLTLYWQASGAEGQAYVPLLQDYTVFVHLLDAAGNQIVNADAPPVNGDYPTSMWQAGDVADDLHLLPLPPDLPTGEYHIAVGLYDPVTGARLGRLDEAGDFVEFPIMVARE
jgi:4-amino-4-deoxy-L-arabinose transferase-like glycosyltransferase